ncbi:MAG: ROK family protein [Pyrinomonadaceae bacterium]
MTVANPETVFAADLGGTHLRVALIDETGKILKQLKQETPKEDAAQFIVLALVNAARECRSEANIPEQMIAAASIMVPGTVDRNNAIVVQAPNLPCLDNFPLRAALQDRWRWPVVLENDANAAAMGEMWLGAARGYRNVICITLGTGVGGGVILNGKLWRGTDGSAGEVGHTTVDPFGGQKCKCGNTGCLEMFASATAIVRMAREELPQYPDSSLVGLALTAKIVYEAGHDGDKLALSVFKRMGTYLGVGLANLINLLNPEIIVIGGGVADGWDLFESNMCQQIKERAFRSLSKNVKIVPAECGDSAGLLGAARLAFDDMIARQSS